MDALQTSSCGNDQKPVLKLNKCTPWLKINNLHSVRILGGLQSQLKYVVNNNFGTCVLSRLPKYFQDYLLYSI